MSRRAILAVSLLALPIAYGLSLPLKAGPVRQVSERQPKTGDVREQERKSLEAGGLAAAAKVTGHYVGVALIPEIGGPANLKELADNSEEIVAASILRHAMRLGANGRSISTCYEVRVEEVRRICTGTQRRAGRPW